MFLFLLGCRGGLETSLFKLWPIRETSALIFLGWLSELFLFLAATALAVAASSGPLLSGFSLGENFLFFSGSLLFPDSSGSLSGSPLGKEFFLLGRLTVPAVSSRSVPTSSFLEKDFSFWGLERRLTGLLLRPPEALLGLRFFPISACARAAREHCCCFLKMPVIAAQHSIPSVSVSSVFEQK